MGTGAPELRTARRAPGELGSSPATPGTALVDIVALTVHGDRHRHVLDIELVDRLHAELGEGDDPRVTNGLGYQVCGAADGHQVHGLVLSDGLETDRTALRLADHPDQARLGQHHLGELVHARGRGGSGRTHHLIAHGIHRTDVVDDAIGEVDASRQRLALREGVGDPLVCRVASGEELAVEEQAVAGVPRPGFRRRERVEVHGPGVAVGRLGDVRASR